MEKAVGSAFVGCYLCGSVLSSLNQIALPKDGTSLYRRHLYTCVKCEKYPPPVNRRPNRQGKEDLVSCHGCGRQIVHYLDFGQYRTGYWCSRSCAYEEFTRY